MRILERLFRPVNAVEIAEIPKDQTKPMSVSEARVVIASCAALCGNFCIDLEMTQMMTPAVDNEFFVLHRASLQNGQGETFSGLVELFMQNLFDPTKALIKAQDKGLIAADADRG